VPNDRGTGASSAHPLRMVNKSMRELAMQLLMRIAALSMAAFLPLGWVALLMWGAAHLRRGRQHEPWS
jgi:hypothetical protein